MSLADQIRQCKHALKVKELAQILNCGVRTIYTKCEQGRMPFLQPCGTQTSMRFDPGAIADWLESKAVNQRRPSFRGSAAPALRG